MKRILRLSSLILALVVTIGLVATTTAPAQALAQSTGAPRAAGQVHVAAATDCVEKQCPADDGTVANPGSQDSHRATAATGGVDRCGASTSTSRSRNGSPGSH